MRGVPMKQKLLDWIKKKGFTYEEGKQDLYEPTEKKICVSKRLNKQNKLYSALHECGHLLVQRNVFSYEKRYKSQVDGLFDKRKCRSLRWRIDFLKEEYDAWDRGYKLAKRLKIPIDREKYYNYASKCLGTYCRWVIDKDWHKWDYSH